MSRELTQCAASETSLSAGEISVIAKPVRLQRKSRAARNAARNQRVPFKDGPSLLSACVASTVHRPTPLSFAPERRHQRQAIRQLCVGRQLLGRHNKQNHSSMDAKSFEHEESRSDKTVARLVLKQNSVLTQNCHVPTTHKPKMCSPPNSLPTKKKERPQH